MPQYNRPPKVKAPRPDEFISFFDRLTRYFLQHQVKLWVLLGAALLVFGGYTFYQYRIGEKMSAVALDYWKAEQAPVAESLGAWEKIQKLNPPSPLREVVDLRVGGVYSGLDKWKEAAQAWASPAERDFQLQSVARLAQGAALENQGEFVQALEVYKPLAESPEDPFRFRAKLGMARSYFGMGENGEAEKILYALLIKGSEAPEPVQLAAWSQLAASKVPAKGAETTPETQTSN